MRPDELFVAQAIKTYLSSRVPGQVVSVEPGDDPPDFTLFVGSHTFPLEVTSTEAWHGPSFGQGQVREATFHASHKRLIKRIEQDALRLGVLQGRYAISFEAPLSAEDFPRRRAQFKTSMLQLLAESKYEPKAFERDVEVEGKAVAWVYKLAQDGMRLYESFEDGALTESPEFVGLVAAMLSNALDSKFHKLEVSSAAFRSVLAIRNTYGLADRAALLQAAHALADRIARFHTVFLISEGRVFALHSKEPEWLSGDA